MVNTNLYPNKNLGEKEKRIFDIFKFYRIEHLSVYPDISPKKIKTAKEFFLVPDGEIPLALYDSTVLTNGKNGIYFGIKGLYWNNDKLSTKPGADGISYDDLIYCEIKRQRIYEVVLRLRSSEKFILPYVGEQTEPSKKLLSLLNLIKYGVTTLATIPIQNLKENMTTVIPLSEIDNDGNADVAVDMIKYLGWFIAAIILYLLWKLLS